MHGSGAVSCSCSLLIRGPNLARCQAEAPLIALCRFSKPALIKHDGFRIIARKDGERVRFYSRPGNDFTHRFPLIVETLAGLRARSCVLDGEAVACDHNGVASFELVRHHRANERIFLYAFDLIELNGDDLRRDPLEARKATLRSMLAKAIVSKRKGSSYRSGRSPDWLKMKNPAAPAE
jgi:ATP-dependent DNA ligase